MPPALTQFLESAGGNELDLKFVRNPPDDVQKGIAFSISIELHLGSSNTLLQHSVETLPMYIALVDGEARTCRNCLRGSLTSSLQYTGDQISSIPVTFSNLKIDVEGVYRFKIVLGSFSRIGMVIEACSYSEKFCCTERPI